MIANGIHARVNLLWQMGMNPVREEGLRMKKKSSSRKPRTGSPAALGPYYGDELIVVIETPKGSQNKFAFEPRFGTFELKSVLPVGAVFPFDFGFVPSTLADDKDPLDILLLMDSPAFPGCVVLSRLIGVIQAEQSENGVAERNDRLLAVAASSVTHRSIRTVTDLTKDLIGQIEQFFVSYNSAKGKTFKPLGRFGVSRAEAIVERGIKRFKRRGR